MKPTTDELIKEYTILKEEVIKHRSTYDDDCRYWELKGFLTGLLTMFENWGGDESIEEFEEEIKKIKEVLS